MYSHSNGVTSRVSRLKHEPDVDRLSEIFPQAAHITLRPGDMLINPPFSWHAIKVDQFAVSLSLRGDKEDVLSWIAYRYFNGNIDHPMLLCFSHFFYKYTYTNVKVRAAPPYFVSESGRDSTLTPLCQPDRDARRSGASGTPYRTSAPSCGPGCSTSRPRRSSSSTTTLR